MAGTIQARDDVGVTEDRPAVEVIYFTDPYCSWCWAAEPVLLRLKESYGAQVHFRTVMGGLVERARDILGDDGARLAALRQHMHQVSERSGQPIDPAFLDGVDDDFSTWPACLHVEAAMLQSPDIGEHYLRRMRRAVMTEVRQGSDPADAERMLSDVEGADPVAWRGALADGSALAAFMEDRNACQELGVSGFPSWLLRTADPGRAPTLLVGFQPYAHIESRLCRLAPWLVPRPPRPVIDLLFDHGPMTTREVQEVQGMAPREALDTLDGLAAEGTVDAQRIAGGTFWSLAE